MEVNGVQKHKQQQQQNEYIYIYIYSVSEKNAIYVCMYVCMYASINKCLHTKYVFFFLCNFYFKVLNKTGYY